MRIPRRTTGIVLGAVALVQACGSGPPTREGLNLVLISLDTVRVDRLSAYGYELPTSPNLERFARESVAFTDCLAQSSSTAPSHMSLFTGQYVHRHGLTDNGRAVVPPATLASALRDHGWETAGFTGHGSMQAKLGHAVGFDVFRSAPRADRGGPRHRTRNLPEVVPEALAWLDERRGEPFFLFVHGYDPHCPYAPPEPWRSELVVAEVDPLDLSRRCTMLEWGPLLSSGAFGEPELRHLGALYDAELAGADAMVGVLLEGLRARELLDRSIVVFTSDHGEVLGDRGWVGHTRLWEEELRVPLLVRFPEGQWAARVSDPVQLIDVAPTLLSALGLPALPGAQGVDLMPRIRNEEAPIARERMRLSEVAALTSVRFDDRFKIVHGKDPRRPASHLPDGPQLYDLKADPGERENLIETPEGRRAFEELWRRYRTWRHAHREDDRRFRGAGHSLSDDEVHMRMLEALGYVTGDRE